MNRKRGMHYLAKDWLSGSVNSDIVVDGAMLLPTLDVNMVQLVSSFINIQCMTRKLEIMGLFKNLSVNCEEKLRGARHGDSADKEGQPAYWDRVSK
jgi:hypothetical protein